MQIAKLAAIALALTASSIASAALSPQDAARLGADLTPLGGEKAGNADGTIPAWDGGITTPPGRLTSRRPPSRPVRGRQAALHDHRGERRQVRRQTHRRPLALLKAYPDYKIIVYPTHRSAAYPQRIYDATKRYATTAAARRRRQRRRRLRRAASRSRSRRMASRRSGTTCSLPRRSPPRATSARPPSQRERRLHVVKFEDEFLLQLLPLPAVPGQRARTSTT